MFGFTVGKTRLRGNGVKDGGNKESEREVERRENAMT
jgi:hypothetical protein